MKQSHNKSEIQDKIVKLLYKNREEKKTVRFTELRKKLGISKPVLSYHLGILKDENIIEFTQEGREKHYRLNEKSPKTLEMKIKDLYLSYVIHHDMVSPDPDDEPNDLLNWLSSIIGCIYLFFMLKSIETGRDWVTNIKLYDFEYTLLENLIAHITEEYEFPINWADRESAKDRNEVYAKIKKITSKRTHQEKLKELIDGLRDVFPDPMSVIDKKIKNAEFNRMKEGRKGS